MVWAIIELFRAIFFILDFIEFIMFTLAQVLAVTAVAAIFSIPLVALLYVVLARTRPCKNWNNTIKFVCSVLVLTPVWLFWLTGISNAHNAASCQLNRDISQEVSSCEQIDSLWYKWIYLGDFKSKTMDEPSDQKQMIR